MSIPTFQLNTTGNAYYDTFGMYDGQLGFTGSRATRHSTVANHNTLAKNIASNHASEFKEAYEYIEDGNISAFQDVINKIQASEASKQRTFNITDAEIATAIEDAYQAVVGADYDTSIAGTKMSSQKAGFLEGITLGIPELLGLGDYKTSAEYVAERRGTEVNADEIAAKTEGRLKGGATLLGLGFLGACVASKGAILTTIGAICASNPIGWIAGGIALTVGGAIFIANQVAKA